MIDMTKRIFLIFALSLLSVSAYANNVGNSALVGNYQCQRIDASNNTTNYSLAITSTGSIYSLEWDNGAGYPALYGTGIEHPRMYNVLAVKVTDPKSDNGFGIELIELKSDGSLHANWSVQSSNQVGTETCTKSK